MRIILAHPSLAPTGGAEAFLIALGGALAAAGHEVLCLTGGIPAGRTLPFPHEPVVFSRRLAVWPETKRRIRQSAAGADAVLCQNFPSLLHVRRALGPTRAGRPRILLYCQEPEDRLYGKNPAETNRLLRRHLADPFFHITRWMDNRAVRDADARFANSARTRAFAEMVFDCSFSILHPVTLGAADYNESALAARREGQTLVTVSRLVRQKKNIDGLLAAFAIVHRAEPKTRLIVAGDGPDLHFFMEMADALGIGAAVSFPGAVSDGERRRLYRQAALAVHLPLDEPFGLGAIEAVADGAPLVLSADCGAAALHEDRVTARLVDPHDPAAAAAAIRELLDDPAARRMMAETAFRRFAETVTLERTVSVLEDALRE
jgi:glycosyltransferase involved in cell wall biosynthesis